MASLGHVKRVLVLMSAVFVVCFVGIMLATRGLNQEEPSPAVMAQIKATVPGDLLLLNGGDLAVVVSVDRGQTTYQRAGGFYLQTLDPASLASSIKAVVPRTNIADWNVVAARYVEQVAGIKNPTTMTAPTTWPATSRYD